MTHMPLDSIHETTPLVPFAEQGRTGSAAGLTILVVEDEPSIAGLVAEMLEMAGYRAVVTHNGRSALALARSELPVLVITDRMMPEGDGVDLVRALRASHVTSAIPVLLMSSIQPSVRRLRTTRKRSQHAAHGPTDTLANAQCAEIDGKLVPFLPKPFDMDELLDLVQALARAPEDNRQLQSSPTH